MSFGGNNTNAIPIPQQEPLGVDAAQTPTNRQARPVPYFAGIRRLGPTYISQAFDVYADPVYQEIEKGDPILSGHDYYWSWASGYSVGPVDGIDRIYVEDVVGWDSGVARSGDTQTITLDGRGIVHIHWGTETQNVNSVLSGLSAANDNGVTENHPPYRGMFYLVFEGWFQGYQRTQVVKVEPVAYRYPSVSGLSSDADVQGDANVPHCILEILTNPRYGSGLDLDRFNLTSFDDASDTLSSECVGISPIVTRPQSMQQVIKDWLQYIRGGLYPDGNGKIAIKLIRSVTKGGGVVNLNEDKLTGPPTLEPSDYLDTSNQTSVTFTNRDRDFKEDAITRIDQGNFQITGTNTSQVLDRSAITRRGMASHVGASESRLAAIPGTSGSISIPWQTLKADGLEVGGVFKLSWAHLDLEYLYCRIISIKRPGLGEMNCEVQFEVDRTYLTELVIPAQSDQAVEQIVQTPEAAPNQTAVEMFYDPARDDQSDEALILATRPNAVTTGLITNRKRPSGSYSEARSMKGFTIYGTLDEAYPVTDRIDTTGFLVTLSGVDKTLDTTLTLSDATQGIWLAFIGAEILSIYDPVLISGSQYRVKAIRQRFDSQQSSHLSGVGVWFAPRAALSKYPEKIERGESATYKIQPTIGRNGPALADITALSVAFTGRKRTPLKALNFAANGDETFRSGEDVELTWNSAALHAGSIFDSWDGGVENPPGAEIQILAAASDLEIRKISVNSGIESYTYSNGTLVSDLGSEGNFRVRIRQCLGGYKSAWSETLTVTLV